MAMTIKRFGSDIVFLLGNKYGMYAINMESQTFLRFDPINFANAIMLDSIYLYSINNECKQHESGFFI